jgi:hypothetical protein
MINALLNICFDRVNVDLPWRFARKQKFAEGGKKNTFYGYKPAILVEADTLALK